jgi:acyl-CoA synthetase (AMP-forming)/AMP-acid ligase II
VPPGTPGEILLKGPTIFLGYHNRPEENANAFRDGWFCTGDIGEVRNDLLYIVDRKKVCGPFRPHKILHPPALPLFASLYLMTNM